MKKHCKRRPNACALIVSALAMIAARSASAAASTHSASARIEPYLMASQKQEIALARTAAPPSISMHATVMVLGAHGYVTAVKGSNGFVCIVTRSWNDLSVHGATFWNPKIRVPYCYNSVAARSRLPQYLMKTQWALGGASESEIRDRLRAAWAAGKIAKPAAGALCYMMSKRSWGVGGHPGPWRPHLMFYFPNGQVPNWGANLPGTPVASSAADDETTVIVVLVPLWSDGSPAPGF